MCIFAFDLEDVNRTSLVVMRTKKDVVRIIYANELQTKKSNLMLLPANGEIIGFGSLPDHMALWTDEIFKGFDRCGIVHTENDNRLLGMEEEEEEEEEYAPIIKSGPYSLSITKNLHKL